MTKTRSGSPFCECGHFLSDHFETPDCSKCKCDMFQAIPETFYRYETHHYGSLDEFDRVVNRTTRVELHEYPLMDVTPKGYWIGYSYFKKWISKTSLKKYAYPTKEEALAGFIARTSRYVSILNYRLQDASEALAIGIRMKTTEALKGASKSEVSSRGGEGDAE